MAPNRQASSQRLVVFLVPVQQRDDRLRDEYRAGGLPVRALHLAPAVRIGDLPRSADVRQAVLHPEDEPAALARPDVLPEHRGQVKRTRHDVGQHLNLRVGIMPERQLDFGRHRAVVDAHDLVLPVEHPQHTEQLRERRRSSVDQLVDVEVVALHVVDDKVILHRQRDVARDLAVLPHEVDLRAVVAEAVLREQAAAAPEGEVAPARPIVVDRQRLLEMIAERLEVFIIRDKLKRAHREGQDAVVADALVAELAVVPERERMQQRDRPAVLGGAAEHLVEDRADVAAAAVFGRRTDAADEVGLHKSASEPRIYGEHARVGEGRLPLHALPRLATHSTYAWSKQD